MALEERLILDTKALTAKGLVEIPEHPIIHFGKQLTVCELLALGASTAVTTTAKAIANAATGGNTPLWFDSLAMPGIGMAGEKPMIMAPFWYKALKNRKANNQTIMQALAKGNAEALPYMRADICGHDPTYSGLTALLAYMIRPDQPIETAAINITAYMVGLVIATIGEVKFTDWRYNRLRKKLTDIGFGSELYYEGRFLLNPESKEHEPISVLRRLQKEFDLPIQAKLEYHDRYVLDPKFKEYNFRRPYLRFRERTNDKGEGKLRTVQAVYSRAMEKKRKDPSLYRCFVIGKHKFYFNLPDKEMPYLNDQIKDNGLRKLMEKSKGKGDYHDVFFTRIAARKPDHLLVSVDLPKGYLAGEPYWIEIKVHHNLDVLQQANDFIAKHFPVNPSTASKLEITRNN